MESVVTMIKRDPTANIQEYEVDLRLEPVRRYLRDCRQGHPSAVLIPLWNLRALQDESRHAGHAGLAERCAWIERNIMVLHTKHSESSDELIGEIARVVEHVKQRAHAPACDSDTGSPREEQFT